MDKDNEIIKLREHYQYLEEYLQQEISKQDSSKKIEILNEIIRKKSDEISNLQIALGVSTTLVIILILCMNTLSSPLHCLVWGGRL